MVSISKKFIIFALLCVNSFIFSQNNSKCSEKSKDPNAKPTEYDINCNFCGYLVPKTNQECYEMKTSKSQCCVIVWDEKRACMPQSSKVFIDRRADFTIENKPASIICGEKGESLGLNGAIDTFFGSTYCGARNNATNSIDCLPRGDETNCCFLSSTAKTTNQGFKILKACIIDQNFTETVVAQTLFPGTNTYLECYNAQGAVQPKKTITTNARFIMISIDLICFILLFLM